MLLIFLKFIASAALLFAFYRIVLRGKASYAVSRAYLLALPIVSLIISVLTFEVYPSGTEFAIEQIDFGHYTAPAAPVEADYVPDIAPAQVTTAAPAAVPTTAPAAEPVEAKQPIVIDWMGLLQWAVPAISLLLLLLAVYYICKVLAIKSKMDIETTAEGYSLVSSPSVDTPFSFAKTIFLPASLNEPGKSLIIRHEKAHIRHRHYADVWFMELITRLLWFNPFVWLCRNELRNIHEFQADHDVIASDVNINAYQTTLLEMVMNVSSPVVNGFNHSFIRRRFVEMKKSTVGTLGRVAKIGTLVWIGAMFCAFTFTEKKSEPAATDESATKTSSPEYEVVIPANASKKFVIEGAVDPGITDSCYLVYLADENFDIIEEPVACVPVINKEFRYEVELEELTACRIRCIFPGGEICSAVIEMLAAPGGTFGLTVHNGYYTITGKQQAYIESISRAVKKYRKKHNISVSTDKPEGCYKTWEHIKQTYWNNFKVERVDFCEKQTVISVSSSQWDNPGLNSDVCLRDSAGNRYRMLRVIDGAPNRYLQFIKGGRYAFEPLPKGTNRFDLMIERNITTMENGVRVEKPYTTTYVKDVAENRNANQKPNFSITFKTELTNEVTGFTLELMTENDAQMGGVMADVDLDNNGEATFSTYLDGPCIAYVQHTLVNPSPIRVYSTRIPLVPGEEAQFTLTKVGKEHPQGGYIRPEYNLTGSKFYEQWNEAQKNISEFYAKGFDEKNDSLRDEYVKKNADKLGTVMQYLIGPYSGKNDYSILSEKTLQNPMVKMLKQRNDYWEKVKEESQKRQEEARANTAPGKMFTDIDLQNMSNPNNRPSLSDIMGKGRHVLVNFFYPPVENSIATGKAIDALLEKYKGKPIDVFSIACTHMSPDSYEKLYKDMGVSHKMYYDVNHQANRIYGFGNGEIILFDPDGTILRRNIAAEELEKVVEEVLQ